MFATLGAVSLSVLWPTGLVTPDLPGPLDRVVVLAQPLMSIRGPQLVVGGTPAFGWPKRGQAAVAVPGEGVVGETPGEVPVPIASITKMMTALVVLADHPLALGAAGPILTVTAGDAAAWQQDVDDGDSNAKVAAGERLSEYQLLEEMLLPSADNIADLLAIWDAGSMGAFVPKMNARAAALGLRATHYVDASGLNPGSRSTAADQAIVAAELMTNPVVRSIVAKPYVKMPVAGALVNYNPALGVDGIIGVKSGFTDAAQGCLATAAYHRVGGANVLVVAVNTGNIGGLYGAANVDEQLLRTSEGVIRPVAPAAWPSSGLAFQLPGSTTRTTFRLASRPGPVIGWPGLHIYSNLEIARGSTPKAGVIHGNVVFSAGSAVLETVPVTSVATPKPPTTTTTTTTTVPPTTTTVPPTTSTSTTTTSTTTTTTSNTTTTVA